MQNIAVNEKNFVIRSLFSLKLSNRLINLKKILTAKICKVVLMMKSHSVNV